MENHCDIAKAYDVLDSMRKRKLGATYSTREVRELDENDFKYNVIKYGR